MTAQQHATPARAQHWAQRYIGAPYQAGASGPQAFDCWGLVCAAIAQRHGLPAPAQAAPLAARALGWRPVHGPLADGDVLHMRSPQGTRHVGMVVRAGAGARGLCLLHALRSLGVCWQPLADLPGLGYSQLQAWRHAA